MERLPLIPIFKWRLAEVPFGLDFAYWVDDPDFDIDFHVRELALVPPGSTGAARGAGRAHLLAAARPQPSSLGDLPDPRARERPRRADDQGASRGDRRPVRRGDPRLAPRPHPRGAPGARAGLPAACDHMPSQLEMLARGLIGVPQYPLRLLRSLPAALPHFEEVGIFSILPGATPGRRRRTAAAGGAAPESDRQRTQALDSPAHVLQRQDLRAPAHRLRPAAA